VRRGHGEAGTEGEVRRGQQRRGEDAQFVVVTPLTSQLPMSGLQSFWPEKRNDMSSTAATFQLEIGP